MSVKLCPANRQSSRVKCDERYSGSFSDCLNSSGIKPGTLAAEIFMAKWYRAQMRCWAGHWRQTRSVAAILGKGQVVVAETYLSLAISYRQSFNLKMRQLGGAK